MLSSPSPDLIGGLTARSSNSGRGTGLPGQAAQWGQRSDTNGQWHQRAV